MNKSKVGITSKRRRIGACAAVVASGLAMTAPAMAQFERTLGIDVPMEHFSVVSTQPDDGFMSGGLRFIASDGTNKIHLTRWGPDGQILWERVGMAPGNTVVHSVFQTSAGDFVVAGETDNPAGGPLGIFVMRVAPGGNLLWARRFTGTPFLDSRPCVTVREILGGDFIVTGREQMVGAPIRAGRLIRLTPGGNPVFNFRYTDIMNPNTGQVNFNDVRQATDGSFWVVGERRSSANAPYQTHLFHVTPAGAPIVAFLYSPAQGETTGDAIDRFLPTGEMVIAGRRTDPASGLQQLRLIRTTPGGVPVWNRFYSYAGANFGVGHTAVAWRPQGDILASGNYGNANQMNAALVLTSPAGDPIWGHLFGLPAQTGSRDLALMPGVEAGMVGFYENGPFAFGARAVYLVRTDAAGKTACSEKEIKPTVSPVDFFQQTTFADSVTTQAIWEVQLVPVESKRDYPCPPCYADCDGDGALSINDFICFQTLFALGDPYADCDGDGALSINDFICYQTAFAIGC